MNRLGIVIIVLSAFQCTTLKDPYPFPRLVDATCIIVDDGGGSISTVTLTGIYDRNFASLTDSKIEVIWASYDYSVLASGSFVNGNTFTAEFTMNSYIPATIYFKLTENSVISFSPRYAVDPISKTFVRVSPKTNVLTP